jgi:hypothetical protein
MTSIGMILGRATFRCRSFNVACQPRRLSGVSLGTAGVGFGKIATRFGVGIGMAKRHRGEGGVGV